jgi:ATP-dependent RNA helicase RhlE
MNFDNLNLNTPLKNALIDLGFETMTPIQEASFPIITSGKDVVGIAQTGTGKTFAYLLPILRHLKFSDQKQPRVLIVVPTRELVMQVVGEIKKLGKYMNIRVVGVYGGANINTQKKVVYEGMDILVATPGRLVDLTFTGLLRLSEIQKLVIDEVDEMLAQGFRSQTVQILELLPQKRQSLMFSATITEDVQLLIEDFFVNPQWVEVGSKNTPVEQIIHNMYVVPNFRTKANLLSLLLQEDEQMTKALVFVADKKAADRLAELLENKFPDKVGVIHSNKSQNYRFGAIARFKQGMNSVLIATDIASKGLDIDGITHVINFNIPEVSEDYIHRTGRTGRADKQGIALNFATEDELQFIEKIEAFTKLEMEVFPLPESLKISGDLFPEEMPDLLYDKEYLAPSAARSQAGAFHEKKDKNKKINLGGPKKRNPKHGKPASREPAFKKKKTKF